MGARTYWAVIGDVVHSRSIKDRRQFQKRLETIIAQANQRFARDLVALWTITTGDEFQALYAAPSELPAIVEFLVDAVHPTRLRIGIGYGELSTELKQQAVGMDGPAFHAARRAVNHAKRKGKTVVVAEADSVMSTVTDVWDLAAKVAAGRTRMQREVAALYRSLQNQYSVAEHLDLTQGTISSHLSRGLFFETEAVLRHVEALLQAVHNEASGHA